MDAPTTFTGFQQYGAVGALAVALLSLFALIFRKLLDNVLEQNKALFAQNAAQTAVLQGIQEALRNINTTMTTTQEKITSELHEVRCDMGILFNQLSADTKKYGTAPLHSQTIRRPPPSTER